MNRYLPLYLKNFHFRELHLEILELDFSQVEFLEELRVDLELVDKSKEDAYLEEWAAAPRRQPGPDSRRSSSRVPDRLLETGATSVTCRMGLWPFSPCQLAPRGLSSMLGPGASLLLERISP